MTENSKNNKEIRPWARNIPSFMVLYSVLAAIAGVLLTVVLIDNMYFSGVWWIPTIALTLAIFLFILSAEKITDALDENDAEKYVVQFIPYNFAVILLFLGLISIVYFRFKIQILSYFFALLGYELTRQNLISTIEILFISICLTHKWWWDTSYLLIKPENVYQEYLEELKGGKIPEFDRGIGYRLFKYIRKHIARKEPPDFKEVLLELHPSSIEGIGVFAVRKRYKGDYVAEGIHAEDYSSLVPWEHVENLDKTLKEKINSFCIGTPEGFFPPDEYDFNKLSIEWFINHSCDGNVGFNEKGDFVAIKEIEAGEEMTYDYGLAESNPLFKMECKCGNKNCRKIITGNDWKDTNFRNRNQKHMLPSLRRYQKNGYQQG